MLVRRVGFALAASALLHGLAVFWLSWHWTQPSVLVGGAQVIAVSLAGPGSAGSEGSPGLREDQAPQAEQTPEPELEPAPEPEPEPEPEPIPASEPEPEPEPEPGPVLELEPAPRLAEQPNPVVQPAAPPPSNPRPAPSQPLQTFSAGQGEGDSLSGEAEGSGGASGAGAFGGDYQLGQADGPALLNFVQPVYPSEARRQGLEGRVLLRVLVGADGKAREVQVLEASHNLFIEPARQSALVSTFRPLQVAGQAREAWVRLPFNFRLDVGQR